MPATDTALPDVQIRSLSAKDMRAFVQLRSEIESETRFMPVAAGERRESLLYNLLKMFLHRKRIFTYLAWRGEELVGYVTVIMGSYRKFRGNAYIANVSVKKNRRGLGIGTMLMSAAEKCAKDHRARRVELEVFAKNKKAWDLYEQLGYEVEGRKRKAIQSDDGFDDLIFMAKFL